MKIEVIFWKFGFELYSDYVKKYFVSHSSNEEAAKQYCNDHGYEYTGGDWESYQLEVT